MLFVEQEVRADNTSMVPISGGLYLRKHASWYITKRVGKHNANEPGHGKIC